VRHGDAGGAVILAVACGVLAKRHVKLPVQGVLDLPMGAGGGHGRGPSHPSWRHGMRSAEWIEIRGWANELARETREIERLIARGRRSV
jgi:hypothetical protein